MRLFKWLSRGKPSYEYRPEVAKLNFQEGIRRLEKRGYRVIPYGVDSYSPGVVAQLRAGLDREGIPVSDSHLDVGRVREYQREAGYAVRHPEYYGTKKTEKRLEHVVTLGLRGLGPGDIFMDVASESSPVPEIYERLVGATTY